MISWILTSGQQHRLIHQDEKREEMKTDVLKCSNCDILISLRAVTVMNCENEMPHNHYIIFFFFTTL